MYRHTLFLISLIALAGNASAATEEALAVTRAATPAISASSLANLENAFFASFGVFLQSQVIQEIGGAMPTRESLDMDKIKEEASRKCTQIRTKYEENPKRDLPLFCKFCETMVSEFTKPYKDDAYESQLAAGGYTAWRGRFQSFWSGMQAGFLALTQGE